MAKLNPFNKIYRSEEYMSVLGHRDSPSMFPFMVDIELTNHCNFCCKFCGQNDMKREKGFMEVYLFEKIVDECAKQEVPIRLIRWGEPLLHPDVIEFCRYAKKKKVPVHITTNGSLLTDDMIKEFIDMKLDSIIFSMQGATKERYEQMRGDHYDLLQDNIDKFLLIRKNKHKPFIQVTSTMTDETPEEIDEFIKHWSIVDSVQVGKTNLSRVKVDGKLKKQETIKKEYRPCTEVYQKLSVDWDGKVSCCCSDWDRFMTVGDIKDNTLKEIWNSSKRLKEFRKILDNMEHNKLEMCKNCFHTYGF